MQGLWTSSGEAVMFGCGSVLPSGEVGLELWKAYHEAAAQQNALASQRGLDNPLEPRWSGDACTCVGKPVWCQPCIDAMQKACQKAEATASLNTLGGAWCANCEAPLILNDQGRCRACGYGSAFRPTGIWGATPKTTSDDLSGLDIPVATGDDVADLVANWPPHAMAERIVKLEDRIAELETEVAALTDTLRTLFKSAVAPLEFPSDAVEFPTAALAHSWATKGPSR